MDECATGCRAICQHQAYQTKSLAHIPEQHDLICHLEALNLVPVIRLVHLSTTVTPQSPYSTMAKAGMPSGSYDCHALSSVIKFPDYPLTLIQLKHAFTTLTTHAFRPRMNINHLHWAKAFINFCKHYNLQFICPASSQVTQVTTSLI